MDQRGITYLYNRPGGVAHIPQRDAKERELSRAAMIRL